MNSSSAGTEKSDRCREVAVSRGSTVSLRYICISSFSNLEDCKTNIRMKWQVSLYSASTFGKCAGQYCGFPDLGFHAHQTIP